MEKSSVRKKNIEILEELSMDIKGLLNETASIKKDIHYIKTYMQTKEKVKQDLEQLKKNQEPIEVGWRLW